MPDRWIETFQGERQRQLYDLYSREWWTNGRQFEDVIRMVEHSDLAVGVCSDGDQLIGFARVLTDYTFKAMIFDVIVHSDFRGQQLGQAIINRIIGHKTLTEVRSFELYCPDALIPFYNKLGFAKGTASLLFRERQGFGR
ncbi:GNAT family N-acetyltransferase [Mesorhizobium sp. B2-4-15]|uniref:GNAT family N-acetyltransferase n=1 Tax=Mesorhizobium sp. B2-4-15 TaxID=2589934 RepID=UPI00114FA182|nr:GNAT family N-acetyltransferase [Mesorhizobium sp. B2-4-15]TPK74084.1 GNAT family N-acetyltransferase [Mesorhizobium sp. B2-4-15]